MGYSFDLVIRRKINSGFGKYSDPPKARRVWEAYIQDIERLGLRDEAVSVAIQENSADSLDVKLDILTSNPPERPRRFAIKQSAGDVDNNGYYSNARKEFEERPE